MSTPSLKTELSKKTHQIIQGNSESERIPTICKKTSPKLPIQLTELGCLKDDVSNINIFLPSESSPKNGKSREYSPKNKILSPHRSSVLSVLSPDHKFMKNFNKFVTFLLTSIIIPDVLFFGVSVALSFFHHYVQDYCFEPFLCQCETILIYFYTLFVEFMYNYLIMIISFYYGIYYVTNDFYKDKRLKIMYFLLSLFIIAIIYVLEYKDRNEAIVPLTKRLVCTVLFSNGIFVMLFSGVFKKDINKNFGLRIIRTLFYQVYCCIFHVLIFKSYLRFYVLDFLLASFKKNLALNIFKVFLLLYNICYAFFSNKLLIFFYKDIIENPAVSMNAVIYQMKFVYIDVYSTNILNLLTSSLFDVYEWIFYSFYTYSIISLYTNSNVLINFLQKIAEKICKIKTTEHSLEIKDLKAGTAIHANIIILLRIICFKILHFFILFTIETELYQDCSLDEKPTDFQIFNNNLYLLCSTQTLMIMAISMYMLKKKKLLFNIQVEDVNLFEKFFIFFSLIGVADYSLQFYSALDRHT